MATGGQKDVEAGGRGKSDQFPAQPHPTQQLWLAAAVVAGLLLYPVLTGTLGLLDLRLEDFLPTLSGLAGGVLNYSNLVGLMVFAFVWWSLHRAGSSLSAVGFPTRWRWWQLLLLGVVIAYPVLLLFSVLPESALAGTTGSATLNERLGGIFVDAVRAGVVEETVFRGLALTCLPSLVFGGRIWPAVAASTVIFVYAHGDVSPGLAIFRVGISLIFCALFLWRKSLRLPIILHWLINALNEAIIP